MIGLIDFSNPLFKYNNKGYTAIVNQSIDVAINHFEKFNNLNLVISDKQILDLFEPLYSSINFSYNASDIFLEDFFDNKTRHNIHNAHTIADAKDLELRNNIFNQLLSPKMEISDEINCLKKMYNIDKKVLALQLRGTDKQTEIPRVEDDKVLISVENFLNKNKLDRIFLSTDDIHYLDLIKGNFGDSVIYNENNMISIDSKPLHFNQDRTKANREVLIDVYLLASCEYFLYCFSNVSYLALTIGSKNFKNIKNINYEN